MRHVVLATVVVLSLWASGNAAWAEDAPVPLQERSFVSASEWVPYSGYASYPTSYPRSYGPSLQQAPRKSWSGILAAYLWATSITGSGYVDGTESDIDIEFSDLFDKLEYAFMGYGEIRYNRWSFAVDGSTLSLKDTTNSPTLGLPVDATLEQTTIDLALGFTVLTWGAGSSRWGCCCYQRCATLDAVVGARYWDLQQEVVITKPDGGTRRMSEDTTWWDPYVGARLRWPFAKRWGLSLYGDVGGFEIGDASNLTWKVQALLRFHVTRGLFVGVGYRALGVDRVTGSGPTQNGVDATYHGPVVGLGYQF